MSMSIGGCGINTSQLASNLFSKLDTKNQGYIDKSELASALSGASDSSDSSSTSSDALFTQLDTNGDGKITQSELSDGLQTLADTLMSQLRHSQMQQMGDMPPPPDDGSDEGFTKDQLTSMASDLSSTDSKRAEFMSKLAANFDAADTDGNGKISRKEAMSFDQANRSDSTTAASSSSSTSATDSSASTDDKTLSAQVMLQLLQLLQSYGAANEATTSATALSVSA